MSILNQSITPSGQPLPPNSKGSNIAHDLSQRRPMALPLQGSHILKSFQPNSLNRALPTLAVGETSHVSMNGISNVSQVLLQHSLMTKGENLDLMQEHSLEALDLSLRQSYTLAVSVTSATKLDSKQMDLISRKMQRLTGFRYLSVENIIDPSVIAGFVISYGSEDSHVIDLSVKGQLASLAARVESSDQRVTIHGQNWSFPSAKMN